MTKKLVYLGAGCDCTFLDLSGDFWTEAVLVDAIPNALPGHWSEEYAAGMVKTVFDTMEKEGFKITSTLHDECTTWSDGWRTVHYYFDVDLNKRLSKQLKRHLKNWDTLCNIGFETPHWILDYRTHERSPLHYITSTDTVFWHPDSIYHEFKKLESVTFNSIGTSSFVNEHDVHENKYQTLIWFTPKDDDTDMIEFFSDLSEYYSSME